LPDFIQARAHSGRLTWLYIRSSDVFRKIAAYHRTGPVGIQRRAAGGQVKEVG